MVKFAIVLLVMGGLYVNWIVTHSFLQGYLIEDLHMA